MDAEQPSGEGILCQLCCVHAFASGCNIQIGQVRAAKGTGGNVEGGDGNFCQQLTRDRVPAGQLSQSRCRRLSTNPPERRGIAQPRYLPTSIDRSDPFSGLNICRCPAWISTQLEAAGARFPGRTFPQFGTGVQDKFGCRDHRGLFPPAAFCWSLRSLAKATSRTASGILLTLRPVHSARR